LVIFSDTRFNIKKFFFNIFYFRFIYLIISSAIKISSGKLISKSELAQDYLSKNIALIKNKSYSKKKLKEIRASIEDYFKLHNYPETCDFNELDPKVIQSIY
tara:strand:- start:24 stop:329 length:306 start_codon:yes stop_codon:yes gene_type:complete